MNKPTTHLKKLINYIETLIVQHTRLTAYWLLGSTALIIIFALIILSSNPAQKITKVMPINLPSSAHTIAPKNTPKQAAANTTAKQPNETATAKQVLLIVLDLSSNIGR